MQWGCSLKLLDFESSIGQWGPGRPGFEEDSRREFIKYQLKSRQASQWVSANTFSRACNIAGSVMTMREGERLIRRTYMQTHRNQYKSTVYLFIYRVSERI